MTVHPEQCPSCCAGPEFHCQDCGRPLFTCGDCGKLYCLRCEGRVWPPAPVPLVENPDIPPPAAKDAPEDAA